MAHSNHMGPNSWGQRGSSAVDHAIAALAGGQYGVVRRDQLVDLGLSESDIDYRVEIGRLRVLHPGVYAVGHDRLAPEGRWLAAVFAGGEEAVLSHRSAAHLWDLIQHNGRIDVTTPRNRRDRSHIHYCRAFVDAVHRTSHRGIPVTTVARTLFDLGAVDPRRVPKAFEQADVLGLLDVRELQLLVDEHPRRPGTGAIRSVLERASRWRGITRRELESRFRDLVDRSGLPAPATNHPLDLVERRIEGDVVWPEARLIVELDSFAFHHTRAAFERDRKRDRLAVAAGWRVMRITWRQLAEQPQEVVRDLRRALKPHRP